MDLEASGGYVGHATGQVKGTASAAGGTFIIGVLFDLQGPAGASTPTLLDVSGQGQPSSPRSVHAVFGATNAPSDVMLWVEGTDAGTLAIEPDGSGANFDLSFTRAPRGQAHPTRIVGSIACRELASPTTH